MKQYINMVFKRTALVLLYAVGLIIACSINTRAQIRPERPPRPNKITIDNPAQGLSFGAFTQTGSGGSVIISSAGIRSATGSVILINAGYNYSAARFYIDAEPGVIVTISTGGPITLTGSGGGTASLTLGTPSTGTSFTTTALPPAKTTVTIGGTLTIGPPANNPAGSYAGTMNVTFSQQ